MEEIKEIPSGDLVIGWKETIKKKADIAIIAENCPEELVNKLKKANIPVKKYQGNQKELGTKLGKPFFVAVVGVKK